ncbi:efflux RND transporter periplasmic adaptor subunit [Paracoccus sp. IB05]|uniref:efflux RND transporter periplasmic adaptor subunit n=1 Tax=Paracoccus sp. IB05 TaxID=2779367 RepID=UPI0018E7BCC0|nr:efflux RND transporter periplasmic adaptor subunit [Paracoccus sp. IB05]MBJ2153149.1 efflux RND transporter periplasmic adaptor subunit [Paracoccus sp. IB05]
MPEWNNQKAVVTVRKWIWRGSLALVAVVGIWALVPREAEPPPRLTTKVVLGSIEDAITVQGVIEPVEVVAVGAQVSGQIRVLHVKPGQQVSAGDPVAEIDSAPQQNALAAAESGLAAAEAQRDAQVAQARQAELTFRRQQELLKGRATSTSDFEQAEAAWLAAKANIAALEAQITRARIEVETARVNLGYTAITAPISGTVIAIATRAGQTLSAVQAAPTIAVIARLDQMTVKVEISEADIARVTPGQDVWFTLMGGDQTRYEAHLAEVDPAPTAYLAQLTADASATQTTRPAIYFNGRFTVPNPDGRLRPLMTAEVRLVRAQVRDVPLILVSALGAAGPDGAYEVEVMTRAGPVVRQIRTGLSDGERVQVLEGLAPGDEVVLPVSDVAPMEMGLW